jgi:hypothetical protein
MRRRVLRSSVLGIALLASASVSADSPLSLRGLVSGIELCEQAVCGSAIFAGAFAGEIADRPAFGLAIGGIIHQTPLPTVEGDCILLLGGSWSIRTLRRTVAGDVDDDGGILCYKGGLQYGVHMPMKITQGGTGQATFDAILDHNPFPPTIKGVISQ